MGYYHRNYVIFIQSIAPVIFDRVSIFPEQNFYFGNGMILKQEFRDNSGSNGNQKVCGLREVNLKISSLHFVNIESNVKTLKVKNY